MIITFQKLNALLDRFGDHSMFFDDHGQVVHADELCELTRPQLDDYSAHGFTIDNEARTIDFTRDGLVYVIMQSDAVFNEHEASNWNGVWKQYELGGDDSVDYCGVIPGAMFEAILEALDEGALA